MPIFCMPIQDLLIGIINKFHIFLYQPLDFVFLAYARGVPPLATPPCPAELTGRHAGTGTGGTLS